MTDVNTRADLSALKLAELQALASSLGISGASKLRKGDLVNAINDNQDGEFAPVDPDLATYSVTAPLIFLALWKHSMGRPPCAPEALDPQAYLASQLHILLNGLRVRPPQKDL